MKKYLIFTAVALLAAASCNKDSFQEGQPVSTDGTKAVSLSISAPAAKSFVSDPAAGTISWEAGDAVGVFTDLDSTPIQFTLSGDPGTTATFTGEVSEGASSFYVFYPYDAEATFSAGKITTVLPSVQSVGENNVAKGAMVSVGTATNNGGNYSVTLKNAFSYIKFKITGEDVKEIVLSGGTDKLAGTATFSVSDASMTGVGTASSITATKADGYFTKDTYYYIPVLPGAVAALSFSMSSNTHGTDSGTAGYDDWKAERVAGTALTFTRGTGLKFDTLDQGSAWNWYFDIHDAASLERFRALVAADKFPAKGVAKFTSDIDLSGETLAAAAGTFKGTLDGQGHSITGWTSEGVSLFKDVSGTVKDFTIAADCNLQFNPVPCAQFGFVTLDVVSGGILDGITNNASITQTVSVTDTASAVIAPIAGRSYGLVQNCTNNGNVAITATAASQNVYLGGIVGYINSGDKLALSNNVNNGDISYSLNAAGKYVYIGGITAATSTSPIASATSSKGTMDNCENYGDVTYYCTNGGSMADNAGTAASGNVCKVGGVTGYFEGNITNCKNEGDVTVTFPTSETGATATAPSIGGVAAFVLRNISGCSNYGQVSLKGTFANAGGDAIPAGAGCVKEPCVGGLVGQVGTATGAEAYSISDCHNYGVMNIYTWMQPGNGTGVNIGGVVGYTKANVSSCSNEIASPGKMMVSNKIAYIRQGGVVGRIDNSSASAYDLTNDSACDFVFLRTAGGNQIKSELHVGGVIGYSNAPAEKLCNKKAINVTVTGDGATGDAQLRFGGVIARSSANVKDALNEGNITITKNAVSNGSVIGGVIGWGNTNLNDTGVATILENRGNITLQGTPTAVQTLYFGGVIGYPDGAKIKGALNSGNLLVNHNSGETNVGGIVGKNTSADARFYNCSNSGTVTVKSNTAKLNLGGIAGYNSNANFLLDNCVNQAAGEIAFSGKASAAVRVGGVIGSVDGGQMVFNSPANYADITVTGSTSSDQNIGGLVGYAPSTKYNGCTVEATIKSPSNANGFVGGIAGRTNVNGVTMKGCRLNVDVQYAANNYHGLVAGSHNSADQTVNLGTDEEPFSIVKGSKLGAVTVNSYTDISSSVLYGSKNAFTLNYSETTLKVVD